MRDHEVAGRREKDRVELVDELLKERGWLVWAGPSSTSPRTGCGPRVGPIRKGRAPTPDDAVGTPPAARVSSPPMSQGGGQKAVQSRAAAGRGANGRRRWGRMRQVADRHQSCPLGCPRRRAPMCQRGTTLQRDDIDFSGCFFCPSTSSGGAPSVLTVCECC